MDSRFLGWVSFAAALEIQENLWREARVSRAGCLLGFESEPVITLGVRGESATDVVGDYQDLQRRGFAIHTLDRGGQATIHNPGQLVIFPVCDVREIGVRRWIDHLAEVSVRTLRAFGVESHWNPDCPGLYTERGKIMSCGVRVRHGISTHGIAINVSNQLEDFSLIRACGVSGARVDRMGEGLCLSEIFARWVTEFV